MTQENSIAKSATERTFRKNAHDNGLALLILFLQFIEDQLSALIGFSEYIILYNSDGGWRKEEGNEPVVRGMLKWNSSPSVCVSVIGLLINDYLLREVSWGGSLFQFSLHQ